ncbi:MAG: ribosome maturation factor RimM [Dissulfurimicrobium sp.]|uniref:ribosome maturation factor RimM n=1 Tax=Dissulfurimicrobium sp. TaxID=2022436 RepID=UPI0040499276
MDLKTSHLVTIGKIIKAHGTRGEVQVYSYVRDGLAFFKGKTFLIGDDKEDLDGLLHVETARPVDSNRLILRIKGVKNRTQAERLAGIELFLEKTEMPRLPDGEYYWHELIGITVVTVEGDRLGILSEIIETGANDVYVINGPRGDILIPAIEEVIKEIDKKTGTMKVILLPGLIDMNIPNAL